MFLKYIPMTFSHFVLVAFLTFIFDLTMHYVLLEIEPDCD